MKPTQPSINWNRVHDALEYMLFLAFVVLTIVTLISAA